MNSKNRSNWLKLGIVLCIFGGMLLVIVVTISYYSIIPNEELIKTNWLKEFSKSIAPGFLLVGLGALGIWKFIVKAKP